MSRRRETHVQGKRVCESLVTLTQLMHPEHANNLGNVHGGVVMRLIDEAGALCAMRHARRPAVTVAVDSLTFLEPVHIGDLVTLNARLTYVGRTSMEVEVCVEAEEIRTDRRVLTNRAYVVYVALDDEETRSCSPPSKRRRKLAPRRHAPARLAALPRGRKYRRRAPPSVAGALHPWYRCRRWRAVSWPLTIAIPPCTLVRRASAFPGGARRHYRARAARFLRATLAPEPASGAAERMGQ